MDPGFFCWVSGTYLENLILVLFGVYMLGRAAGWGKRDPVLSTLLPPHFVSPVLTVDLVFLAVTPSSSFMDLQPC